MASAVFLPKVTVKPIKVIVVIIPIAIKKTETIPIMMGDLSKKRIISASSIALNECRTAKLMPNRIGCRNLLFELRK